MKTVIHVNQHIIRSNHKNPDKPLSPPLTVKTYKDNRLGNEAVIRCKETGKILGKFIYRPHKPLSCGAKVWFECDTANVDVEVSDEYTADTHSESDLIDQTSGDDSRVAQQTLENAGVRVRPSGKGV